MPVRPLRLFGASALRALEQAASQVVADWAAQWGVAPEWINCELGSVEGETIQPEWRQGWRCADAAAWLDWADEFEQEIQRALFSAHGSMHVTGVKPSRLAPLVAADASGALLAKMAPLVLGAGAQACPPGDDAAVQSAPMSGAKMLTIWIGKRNLACLLNGAAVQSWAAGVGHVRKPLPRLGKLNVRAALDPVELALPVRLGTVDVNLASLMSVAVGDVIRLDVALDQHLEVDTPDGKPLFAANIGRTGPSVAVEVVAPL